MNQDRTNRKLAAIFSTDVVGYSRMMEADETWTIQNLEENKQLMSSLIEDYKGRVVDSPGDNLLAEFSSVINAVECAVKIQKELNRKNSKLMEDHRMLFRIGVNLGDVVEEGGKIYGNGVNIAARLESLAEPGGVCISGTAYDQVKSKIEVDYDCLGEYQVKNINEPVRVYRILMGGESTEKYVPHGESKKIINPIRILTAIIVLLVIALGTIITLLYPKPPEPKQVVFSEYELPEGQQFFKNETGNVQYQMAVSPDGSSFVYAATDGLYMRKLDELTAKHIAGTEKGSEQPFFSPDGKWIGYFSRFDAKLKKVNINGGVPISLCDFVPVLVGASWSKDDTIVFSDPVKGIMRVSAGGGTPETIIKINFTANLRDFPLYPELLPDGDTLLFTNSPTGNVTDNQIVVQSLQSKERNILIKGGWMAKYLPTGHISYISQGKDVNGSYNLFIIPFDYKKMVATPSPVFMLENIKGYAFSETGILVYVPHEGGKTSAVDARRSGDTLVWVDMAGNEKAFEPFGDVPKKYEGLKISPDGTKVAITVIAGGNSDIYISDIPAKTPIKLTFDKGNEFNPIWTPDGSRIVYILESNPGIYGLSWKLADGMGETESIYQESGKYLFPTSFSHDQKFLSASYWSINPPESDIALISMEGNREVKKLLMEDYAAYDPQISPKGGYIAYTSTDETGKRNIFVRTFPDVTGGQWQISDSGGGSPLWSPDGKQLFYRNGDATIAVEVETEPKFKIVNSKTLFHGDYKTISRQFVEATYWDIHPDGERFLMIKPSGTSEGEGTEAKQEVEPQEKIIIVTNWFEELKEKVPSD